MILKAKEKVESTGKELKLLASPWSPPAWMKTNNEMDHSGNPGLKESCRDVWAKYIARWVTAYKNQGIPIWAMTVQNEPMANSNWEACLQPAEWQAEFIANFLGPTMKSAHPEVGIFAFDHNKGQVEWYGSTVSRNSQAASYLAGIAFHWYGGDRFENVLKLHKEFPQYIMLPSEATYEKYRMPPYLQGSLGNNGNVPFGLGYAHDILGDLNAGGVGWIDWNIILDTTGGPNHVGNTCDAAIIGDPRSQQIWKHPQYYYIGHFSKFLLPGTKIAKTTISGSWSNSGARPYGICDGRDGLEATTGVRPDKKIVVVVLNCGNSEQRFSLRINRKSTARGVIPAQGIQTYLFSKSWA